MTRCSQPPHSHCSSSWRRWNLLTVVFSFLWCHDTLRWIKSDSTTCHTMWKDHNASFGGKVKHAASNFRCCFSSTKTAQRVVDFLLFEAALKRERRWNCDREGCLCPWLYTSDRENRNLALWALSRKEDISKAQRGLRNCLPWSTGLSAPERIVSCPFRVIQKGSGSVFPFFPLIS